MDKELAKTISGRLRKRSRKLSVWATTARVLSRVLRAVLRGLKAVSRAMNSGLSAVLHTLNGSSCALSTLADDLNGVSSALITLARVMDTLSADSQHEFSTIPKLAKETKSTEEDLLVAINTGEQLRVVRLDNGTVSLVGLE